VASAAAAASRNADSDDADDDDDTDGDFLPTYQWRPVRSGQRVPGGLEIRLRLVGDGDGGARQARDDGDGDAGGGGSRLARIPPDWQLRVWCADDDAAGGAAAATATAGGAGLRAGGRFFRHFVTASTAVGEVTTAIADELDVPSASVWLTLAPETTTSTSSAAAAADGADAAALDPACTFDAELFRRRGELRLVITRALGGAGGN